MWVFKLDLHQFRSNKPWRSRSQSNQPQYLCLSDRLLLNYRARLLQYNPIASPTFARKCRNRAKYWEEVKSSCEHNLDFKRSRKRCSWSVIKIPLGNGQRFTVHHLHEKMEGKLASKCKPRCQYSKNYRPRRIHWHPKNVENYSQLLWNWNRSAWDKNGDCVIREATTRNGTWRRSCWCLSQRYCYFCYSSDHPRGCICILLDHHNLVQKKLMV